LSWQLAFYQEAFLRYRHGFNRRRKIAARSHAIPKLVQIVANIPLELRNRLVVYTGASSIVFHSLEGFPDERLGNYKRLRHLFALLLLTQLA
jgi:hypothetical protein